MSRAISLTSAQPPQSPSFPASVLIPTYNRADALLRCLRSLEQQTTSQFEAVVMDDGSTDRTPLLLAEYARTAPFALRCMSQPNGGPARARNTAIASITTPLVIMIGDDIFPAPGFVEAHLRFHSQHLEPEAAAVGLTVWAKEGQRVTPLMRWLGSEGVQFGYRALLAGKPPDWRYFYSSNLSVKRALLGSQPFHEGFRFAGMEDIELGYRLTRKRGLRLSFLADAVAEHLHPVTFKGTCSRARMVGASTYQFEELWPEQRAADVGWKSRLLQLLAEERVVLPTLTALTRLLTAIVCPNPLLERVLRLHSIVGHRSEAANPQQGKVPPRPAAQPG